ncbi:MAG TPA: hypothetical protein VN380_01645 [Thermoanaerobaculia bacterium]|jgi:hypothetical protein|nr:hypothetical protein [Thermoanaerobaculia bacterium]
MKATCALFSMLFVCAFEGIAQAQSCGPCQPGVQPGYSPGSPMTVYLDWSLSSPESNAAADAVAGWNQWFIQQGYPPPFSVTINAFAANVTIKEDPQLHNTGLGASTTPGAGTIETNPDYQNRTDGFLSDVLSHEFGHMMGFTDVNTPTCQGQTVMYGSITPGGPYTTGPTSTDWCALGQYAPPSRNAENDPTLNQCDPTWGCAEPIIFNLGDGSYDLSGLEDPVSFDIFGVGPRGGKPQVGWTKRGVEIAFLVLDRNGNGVIDGGGELFGNGTLLRNGQHAANGFDALAEYDDNADGQIDAADRIWQYLLLWTDRNHDGISQPEELQRICDSSITAIELRHHRINRRDGSGNYFGYEGLVHEGRRVRPFFDVFFVIGH